MIETQLFLNENGSPEEILEKILKKISYKKDIGFAGIQKKEFLKNFLKGFIFDKNKENQPYSYNPKYEKEIVEICKEVSIECNKYINKKVYVFLFPTFDKFVLEKMGGVNGFSPWDNVIWIFINFKKDWKESLKETIVHELAHALSPFYKGGDLSIGFGLILDGLAEHFKGFILSERRAPWTQAISEEKAKEVFNEIKDFLDEKDFDKYNELFFGTGKYPTWTGYTIGYYLIKEYLKENPIFDWSKLLVKNPKEILRVVRF